MAKFKANLGPIAVWEAMKTDTFFDQFQPSCPEELRDEMAAIYETLVNQEDILDRIFNYRRSILNLDFPAAARAEMKATALKINNEPEWLHKHLFAWVRRDKEFDAMTDIYPKGNQYVKLEPFLKGL
jgi:hypothetical protein